MDKEKINLPLLCFRIFFTCALLYTVFFIFRNSMQIAEVSSARSISVMNRLNRFLGPLGIGPIGERLVRKLAHFAEYSLLGFFAMLCMRVYTARFIRHISWPLLFGLLVAVTDETIQLYATGRSSQITDVWIDFTGCCCGLGAALMMLVFFRMVHFLLIEEKKRNDGTAGN